MKIVAVIPAYNEEDRVVSAINDAVRFVDAVVVVDDCSADRTAERVRSVGAFLVRHSVNRGQGAALQTGTDFALRFLYPDVLVHFDADGQMAGEDIPRLVQPILENQADVVLGSRFLGSAVSIPWTRRLLLKAGILFTFLVSGLWLSDTHNGFRVLKAETARRLRITLNRMAHASEIIDLIAAQKCRVVEVPVTIRYTTSTLEKGQRSLGSLRVILDVVKGQFFK